MDAQGASHVGQGHPQEVVHGDDRSMSRIEARERRIQELSVGKGGGDVQRRRVVDRAELDLDDPAIATPDEVETGVDGQAMEPGVEPVRVAETGQVYEV